MIKSSRWHFRSITGKIMMGLVVTAIMSSINVAPSFGDDDSYRWERGGHDRHYANREQWHDHGRSRHGRWYDKGRYRYYDDGYREIIYVDPGYRERVYVPPPVVYVEPAPVYVAPRPAPGLSIFFSTRN